MPDIVNSPLKPEVEKVTLFEWISEHNSEDEMREVFLNMDIALNYIHNHGYCIQVFFPSEIFVLNNRPDYIQFSKLMELSHNELNRRDMIREDIFNSSMIQIGFYTNSINNLSPKFIKENFDEISQFLPDGDVPYYRGIIERGSSVYFSDYAREKKKRDLNQLSKEFGDNTVDTNDLDQTIAENEAHNKINDSIYRIFNRDAAFVNFLIVPAMALLTLLIIGLIGWIVSLF